MNRSAHCSRVLTIVAATMLIGSCGFFNPDNPPDPIWGVWTGPYPTTISTEPAGARWVFSSHGIYFFHALNADGGVIFRESGYYHIEGAFLSISSHPSGDSPDRLDMLYWFHTGDRLTLDILGGQFTYTRIGDWKAADDYTENVPETLSLGR